MPSTPKPCKHDRTSRYRSAAGETLSYYQIAMLGANENNTIERTDRGVHINGEFYRFVETDE